MATAGQSGPPYTSPFAAPGLIPNIDQDAAPSAVFILLYLGGAIGHQVIFQLNRRRGHMFWSSYGMFAFCMGRIVTFALRLAWAIHPDNARLAIAANIFTYPGVLAIYAILLLLSLRTFRAVQPQLGWKRGLDRATKVSYWLLGLMIAVIIAFFVLSSYTLNPRLLDAGKWIMRAGELVFLLFNLWAPALLTLSILLPRDPKAESFGAGSTAAKLNILGISIFFTLIIAGFRCGVAWSAERTLSHPAWYDSRAAFYALEFGLEIIITYFWLLVRIDQRFWIPKGSKGPGDYSRPAPTDKLEAGSIDDIEHVLQAKERTDV